MEVESLTPYDKLVSIKRADVQGRRSAMSIFIYLIDIASLLSIALTSLSIAIESTWTYRVWLAAMVLCFLGIILRFISSTIFKKSQFIGFRDMVSLLALPMVMYLNFKGSRGFDVTILAVMGGLLLAAIFRRAHMCWRLITRE